MHTRNRFTTLVLAVGAPIFTACDDSTTGLGPADDLDETTLTMDAELEISVDAGLAATALTTAEAVLGQARTPSVRARLLQAEDHFRNARRRWAAGDAPGARDRGRRAREAISDALLEGRGTRSVDNMIYEAEALIATLAVPGATYTDAADLASTLSGLVDQAREARDAGSDRVAGERMVAARQHTDRASRDRARDSDRRHDVLTPDILARLQVAQGSQAIQLAWGLIGGSPSEAQLRLMETAAELQSRAEAALAAGELGSAAALAYSAEIKALLAVVAADGVSHAGIQSVAEVSAQLLAEARAVVAAGGSAVDKAILKIAVRLYEQGAAQLAAGDARGVVLLWHSATMSAVLIG